MAQDNSHAGEAKHQEGLMTLKVMVHNGIAVSVLHTTPWLLPSFIVEQ